jgi:glycosyltransferase involved in cell wall biosynthesis
MQFSVIIPAKNEQANIGRCLDSILQVDWDPQQFEIIVVDNGSSDATVQIARQKGAVVLVQPGLTISALRNFGAARARGEILAFMDSDCTVAASWLCQAAKYLLKSDIVCFGSPPQVPPGATWVQRAWFQVRRKKVAVGETQWLESMNMFVRREAFSRCHGFDEKLVTCEDYDLSIRLQILGKVFTDTDIVAVHYGEASSLTHFFRKELWRGIGNLKGVLRHGVKPSEMPSVCLPMLHCLVFLALPVALLLNGFSDAGVFPYAGALFLFWQVLLFLLSFLKYHRSALRHVAQIFVLLNVYYLARGAAFLRQS